MAVASSSATAAAAEKIDYEAIGLWDDGPCDNGEAARSSSG